MMLMIVMMMMIIMIIMIMMLTTFVNDFIYSKIDRTSFYIFACQSSVSSAAASA